MRAAGVALAAAGALGFGFTYSDHAALIPLLASEFGLTDLQAGLLSTALFVAYLGATLVTSGLPDRIGPKPVIAAGLAVSAVGTGLIASSPAFEGLLLGKAIQGIGSALARDIRRRLSARLRARAAHHPDTRRSPGRMAGILHR
ncbi:MAG: MFS transporter [Chloroflexi bacterium]|nr:MAG: MFS transporter [Chloroflexota bacterium]